MCFSFFFSMLVSNGHAESIIGHLLLFLSKTVISGRLCSRVLPVYIGKTHKTLWSSDSETFSGLCMYHFSALFNPHFSHSYQCSILAMLPCLTCLYSFCSSFEHSEKICATVSSAAPRSRQTD